jgi:hypothetical protein
MKLVVTKASNDTYLEKIEIETLKELFDFVEQNGDCIISTETPYEENDKYFEAKGLMIYDDYIE